MKRLLTLGIATVFVSLLAFSATGVAAEDAPQGITHGEFAQLLFELMSTNGQTSLSPAQALAEAQRMELLPATWGPNSILTHGDLAEVANIFGVTYVPPGNDIPVTRGFAVALLHRYRQRIQAKRSKVIKHGFAEALGADPGVDRAISPSNFQQGSPR